MNNIFVKEIVVNYLWMVSLNKKFCLGALGSSCPKCTRAFLFYSDGRKLAFPDEGRSEMLLNDVNRFRLARLRTISRNLNIRIHHLMQLASEFLPKHGGRGKLALPTYLPAVSLLSKLDI